MSDVQQSRYVSVKTAAISPDTVVSFVREHWPDAAVLWATHDKDGNTPHTHLVIRFSSSVRWTSLRRWLMASDAHSYSAPARSWSRSVRYLLHLDNPEKTQYPVSSLHSTGIDADEVAQLVGSKSSYSDIFFALGSVVGLSTGQQFLELVGRGFRPSDITQVLRCLRELDCFRSSTFRGDCVQSCERPAPHDAHSVPEAFDGYLDFYDLPESDISGFDIP